MPYSNIWRVFHQTKDRYWKIRVQLRDPVRLPIRRFIFPNSLRDWWVIRFSVENGKDFIDALDGKANTASFPSGTFL
jgi:hypothetical protein